MTRPDYRTATFIVIACCAAAVMAALALSNVKHNTFYGVKDALADSHITGDVYLAGRHYEVSGSTVQGPIAPLSPILEHEALKVMYALTLAKRTPVFGLAGVNPDSLDAATAKLEAAQKDLIGLQKDAGNAKLVRSLYPIVFLRAISAAERARLDFISSASDSDAARYNAALKNAAREGVIAADSFNKAFAAAIGSATFRIGSASGTLTGKGMLSSIAVISERMKESSAEIDEREACMDGKALCRTNLSLPDAPEIPVFLNPAAATTLAREVLAVFQAAIPPAEGENRVIALSSSVCVSALDAPYFFSQLAPVHAASVPFRYVGNILFLRTSNANQPLMQYMKNTLGITYNISNPFVYYMCPEVGDDLARLLNVQAIAQFAYMHPDIAIKKRSALAKDEIYESDAQAYLRDALAEARSGETSLPPEASAELYALALAQYEKGTGLDIVIKGIAETLTKDIEDSRRGVPFPFLTDMKILFTTQSPFPSLFLAHNPSFGTSQITLHESNAAEQVGYFRTFLRYSDLKSEIPRELFVHDIREHAIFEGASL